MPPQRRKGSIGGSANPLSDNAEHTPPVSPLRDAEWRSERLRPVAEVLAESRGTEAPPVTANAPSRGSEPVAERPGGAQSLREAAPVPNSPAPNVGVTVDSPPVQPVIANPTSTATEKLADVLTMPLPAAGDGPLNRREQEQLSACESSIDSLRIAFWAAGRALQIVRDGRLYRARYSTFDDYVEQRWDMQRSYAHKLIRAWPLAARLHPVAPTINEGQVRELLPVAAEHGEDAAVTVYTTIAGAPGGKVTAGKLREAIALLPERFDEAEVVERLQAWLRGEVTETGGDRSVDLFSTMESRLVALTRRVVKGSSGDPAAAREFAARLRTLAEQIEEQITA
ncbi:hypothetical protein [Nocardia bhagyanarayanae]|uniref:Uncharacterized protein n=1 Tax=Nocardia bhagyanarayanae TaxID=1215925 RepID=A0A543F4W0_9NOCA|nr:hypothetical protein [Nocardia bhagyanarayanae]TQM28865.1 hypothetical protein FB390_0444 [Nocardia bhagyanarayanae]